MNTPVAANGSRPTSGSSSTRGRTAGVPERGAAVNLTEHRAGHHATHTLEDLLAQREPEVVTSYDDLKDHGTARRLPQPEVALT